MKFPRKTHLLSDTHTHTQTKCRNSHKPKIGKPTLAIGGDNPNAKEKNNNAKTTTTNQKRNLLNVYGS